MIEFILQYRENTRINLPPPPYFDLLPLFCKTDVEQY